MTYQLIQRNLQKRINESKALLGQVDNDDYSKFRNLPFYDFDKPITEQQGTFVELVGFPRKWNKDLPMFDYEQSIFDYLERDEPSNPRNKHLAIIKSAGLGITTFLLYYIGWKCTVNNNAWKGKRVSIITSPRIELTVDIVSRLKNIFMKKNLLQFDNDRNTTCTINGCIVEALPASNAAIKSIRGYDNIVMLLVDEASWFNLNQNQNVTDSIERYAAKSNPILVACSTPQTVGDWLYNIKQQKEEDRFYHLMELSYKVGLGKIYTEQEIELQKKSLSFNREYNLSFEAGIDALFNAQDIESCIAETYDSTFHNGLTCWAGVDPGYSTSKFAIVVIAWADGKIQVMKELEVDHADPDLMRHTIHELVQEYSLCRLFIDSSSIFLIRQLCKDYGINDVTMFDDKTKDALLMTNNCGGSALIQSVNFRTKHKLMLEQLHRVVSTQQIRINPRFKGVISALRTATTKQFGDVYDLDKKQSGSNDLLDALRLSLLCLRSGNN
jgi:Terminase large subunit, T4likevirus-type, N-terminal